VAEWLLCECIAVLQHYHDAGATIKDLLPVMKWFLVCVLKGVNEMHKKVSTEAGRLSQVFSTVCSWNLVQGCSLLVELKHWTGAY
jgi:Na+/citrate or Na+/malate symporter